MKKLRNDLLQSAIIGTEQRRDKALRELIRLQTKLDELRKKAARRLTKRVARTPEPPLDPITQATLVTAPQREDDNDPLGIPEFLRRGIAADNAVRAEIEKSNAERKRVKSLVRIEKMKAKQSGETRKMPLSGKDALKFIKEGA